MFTRTCPLFGYEHNLKVGSKFQCDVLTLRKDEYEWQTAAIDITAGACSWDGNTIPAKLNVFELAGVGTTSRALRALSNDGKECIIKMYVQKYIDGGKQISEIDFKSTAKSSVEREVSTYHELYPELRNFIWTQVLNGYHCVILPYFLPIPKEEWLNSIESIKDILKKFKVGNYRFVESDMRW